MSTKSIKRKTKSGNLDPDFGGGPGAPLGTTAKSFDRGDEHTARRASRVLRYQAQSQAREILARDARAHYPTRYPGDVYRTADCRFNHRGRVEVWYSAPHQAAHYGALVTCGSVWACPVCAAKIQERRRVEIEKALSWASGRDLQPDIVTFTFPHRSWQRLADLRAAQSDALARLRQSKGYRTLKKQYGLEGLIRSLEVTHGANGWHPHTHELWFLQLGHQAEGLRDRLTSLWEAACSRAGLLDPQDSDQVSAFRRHAVHVQADTAAGDYLAKQDDSRSWGMAHEVAKASSKLGRRSGVHPHHFLVRQAPGDSSRFLEYVQGMKGARQLYWTPGLKKRVGLDDQTDADLAEESHESADLLGSLRTEDWRLVRGNDARAELLDVAERFGWQGVQAFLDQLRG